MVISRMIRLSALLRARIFQSGFLLVLLTVTLLVLYGVIAWPGKLRAKTAPAPVPAPVTVTEEAPPIGWPNGTITGRVLDPRKAPVAGASVVADGREVRTVADGTFTLPT